MSGTVVRREIDWSYDNLGRLVDEVFNHYDDLLDQTLGFSYDLVGNRLEQTKDAGNDGTVDEKITYTYDDNDRLLTESKDADNDGTVEQTTNYSYTATEQTGKTVVDESIGNPLLQTSFTYNLQGRLESATIETYDGTGTLTHNVFFSGKQNTLDAGDLSQRSVLPRRRASNEDSPFHPRRTPGS